MASPAFTTRHLINTLEHNLKVVEVTTVPEKDITSNASGRTVEIKKLMVYTAQGSGDQTTFEEMTKAYKQKLEELAAKQSSIKMKEKFDQAFKLKFIDKFKQDDLGAHNFELSTQKNKPCALDGSIRDSLSKM